MIFAVKEFTLNDEFIRCTFLNHHESAIAFAEKINETQQYINVVVTEVDCDDKGFVWELVVWKGND